MVPIINVTSIRWVLTATIRICLFNFEVTNCLIVIIPRKELFEDIINIFLLIIPGIIILYNYITYQNHFHRYYKSVHKVKVLKLILHKFLFKYILYSEVQVSEETFHPISALLYIFSTNRPTIPWMPLKQFSVSILDISQTFFPFTFSVTA